jgi:hypothetical protein
LCFDVVDVLTSILQERPKRIKILRGRHRSARLLLYVKRRDGATKAPRLTPPPLPPVGDQKPQRASTPGLKVPRLPPPSLPRQWRPEASASGSETATRRHRSKLSAASPSDRLPSLPRAPADGVEIDGEKRVSGQFRSDLTHTVDGQPVAVRGEDAAEGPRHRRGRPWRRRLSPLLTPPLFFFEADTTQERPQPRRHHPCSPSRVVPEGIHSLFGNVCFVSCRLR